MPADLGESPFYNEWTEDDFTANCHGVSIGRVASDGFGGGNRIGKDEDDEIGKDG